jgi:hypothetical protein
MLASCANPALSACSSPCLHSLRIWLLAPPCSPRLVQCSSPHPLSVVDYNSLCMFLSFVVCVGSSICPGAALEYVPTGWMGESCVVCSTHLLGLQTYIGSFEICWWGETVCHFSQGSYWEWAHPSGAQVDFPQVSGPVCCRVWFNALSSAL